jgi:hypothetical protein
MITGKVQDSEENPYPGITVTATNTTTGNPLGSVLTNADSTFMIPEANDATLYSYATSLNGQSVQNFSEVMDPKYVLIVIMPS